MASEKTEELASASQETLQLPGKRGVESDDEKDQATCECEYPYSSLQVVVMVQTARLSSSQELQYTHGLRVMAEEQPHGLNWFAACSGTGIFDIAADVLTDTWKKQYGIGFTHKTKVFCEKASAPQRHLINNFNPDVLVEDLIAIGTHGESINVVDGKRVGAEVFLGLEAFHAGFSCTSRS